MPRESRHPARDDEQMYQLVHVKLELELWAPCVSDEAFADDRILRKTDYARLIRKAIDASALPLNGIRIGRFGETTLPSHDSIRITDLKEEAEIMGSDPPESDGWIPDSPLFAS